MDPARRERPRESWVERAERIRDAFGLVLASVLLTYVLASLLANRAWGAAILCVATSATSLIALTSAHARPRLFRSALYLSGATILLAVIGAASGDKLWLNVATVIQVLLLAVAVGAVLQRGGMGGKGGSRAVLRAPRGLPVPRLPLTLLFRLVRPGP